MSFCEIQKDGVIESLCLGKVAAVPLCWDIQSDEIIVSEGADDFDFCFLRKH